MKKGLLNLSWKATFTQSLPGDPTKENFSRMVPNALHSFAEPVIPDTLKPVIVSVFVATLLGLEDTDVNLRSFRSLQQHLREMSIEPWAMRYTGHQFGYILEQLGDGRAITLGEVEAPGGVLYDFQLKGAGRTPYSRIFDGKATLRSTIREFIGAEALRTLGASTTHMLGVFKTGEKVKRAPMNEVLPSLFEGAIGIRVAQSLVRFGHFDLNLIHKSYDLSRQLLTYLIKRHFPDRTDENPAKVVFANAVEKTAAMIAQWMAVGFVHGVMNTDNMSILGETIDYGPYGFLEEYRPEWTPNTTDNETLRYSYGNQPAIGYWNLEVLSRGLGPLIDDPKWTEEKLEGFWPIYTAHHTRLFGAKLGLTGGTPAEVAAVVEALLAALESSHVDFTIFFREFSGLKREQFEDQSAFLSGVAAALYTGVTKQSQHAAWNQFLAKFLAFCDKNGVVFDENRRVAMERVNPRFIPRNWQMSRILDECDKGDFQGLQTLHRMVLNPFDTQGVADEFYTKQIGWTQFYNRVSQLSCSS